MKTQSPSLLTVALATCLFGATAPLGAQTSLAPPAGLVGWWPGDAHFFDLIGGNNGTPSGGVTFTQGKVAQGFAFNGSNQGMTIAHSPALDVPPTGFTVVFWMQAGRDQADFISSIVDKDHSGGGSDFSGWEVSCWRDTGKLSFGIGDGSSFPLCQSVSDVLDNRPHHVAFAWDQVNWLIYVDGVLENSLARATVVNNTRPLRFGYHWGGPAGSPSRFFKGMLDEVGVFQRALAPAEIAAIHAADSAGMSKPPGYRPAGLVSWWRGEGNTNDTMGIHPGTPQGGLAYVPGQVGQAFALNGQNAAVALGNWFTLQQFTLSLWVKPGASQVQYADLLDNVHSDYRSWAIQYDNVSDGTRGYWHWGDSLPSGGGAITFALAHNTWQHWVLTLGADRVQHLYLNGKLAGSTTNTAAIPYDGSQFFNLGKHELYGRHFNGLADELMVFDRTLDAAEVAALHVSQGGPPTLAIQARPGGILLSWPLGAPNATLETQTGLSPAAWVPLADAVFVPVGERITVLRPATDAYRFFRLRTES